MCITLDPYIKISVFLALMKVGVGQYEDSDSKPGVRVSTQTRQTATEGARNARGWAGICFHRL